MTTRSEAARKGWETRRTRAEQAEQERIRIAALHLEEAERAWARMTPEARKTALERGFGAHLEPDLRHTIAKRHVIEQ